MDKWFCRLVILLLPLVQESSSLVPDHLSAYMTQSELNFASDFHAWVNQPIDLTHPDPNYQQYQNRHHQSSDYDPNQYHTSSSNQAYQHDPSSMPSDFDHQHTPSSGYHDPSWADEHSSDHDPFANFKSSHLESPGLFFRKYDPSKFEFTAKLIDFVPLSQPLIDRIAIEAIDALTLPDGSKFFNIQYPCKLFTLESDSQDVRGGLFTLYWSEVSKLRPTRRQQYSAPVERMRSAWKRLTEDRDFTRFQHYKDQVTVQFINLINQFKNNVESIRSQENFNMHPFENSINLLPIYLLYVDLISAIMPVEDFDQAGQVLRSQRHTAGEIFCNLLYQVTFNQHHLDVISDPLEAAKNQVVKDMIEYKRSGKNPAYCVIGNQCIWKALHYWMLTSRPALLKGITTQDDFSPGFKPFFSALVYSWVEGILHVR